MRRSARDREFESFYAGEAARVHRLAILMVQDRERAAELAQEAMLRAYTAWHRIHGGDPGPYVRRILINLCRSHHRRRALERNRRPEVRLHEGDHSGRVDDELRMSDLLQRLSPIRRATIVLRFYEDRPEAEIADILDRPLGTVKSDIHRALKTLRPLLEDSVKEAP